MLNFKGLSEFNKQTNLNGFADNDDMLDIVGKGYNYSNPSKMDPNTLDFYLEMPSKSNKYQTDNNFDFNSANPEVNISVKYCVKP